MTDGAIRSWGRRRTTRTVPRRVASDATTLDVRTAQGCAAPTVLYTVQGGGHHVPRADRRWRLLDRYLGAINHDIDSAEEIWSFFSAL